MGLYARSFTPMEQFPLSEATWLEGLEPGDYFGSLANYRHLVLSLYRDAAVADSETRLFAAALPASPEEFRIVVVTEDWCGDSAVTLPYIARLADSVGVPMRIFRQSVHEDLKGWYTERDTDHIPAVSILRRIDGAWRESVRWVERPRKAHERFDAWIEDHPGFEDLRSRKDDDREAAKEYFNLYARLLRESAGWYRSGLWIEIARELSEGLMESAAEG